jgi:TetR/AcrR family hemagglutinin/protease transcriptional regulator
VLDVVENFLIEIVTRSLSGDVPVVQALETLATVFANEAHEKSDIIKVWLDWSTGVRAGVWPRYLVLLGKLHAVAAKLFQRGKTEGALHPALDVDAAARLFIGGGHTLALMQFADVSDDDVKVFIDHFTRSVMAIGESDPVSCDQ